MGQQFHPSSSPQTGFSPPADYFSRIANTLGQSPALGKKWSRPLGKILQIMRATSANPARSAIFTAVSGHRRSHVHTYTYTPILHRYAEFQSQFYSLLASA